MDLQAMMGSSASGSRNYTDLVWGKKIKRLQSKQTRWQMRLENQRGRPLSITLGQWPSDTQGNRSNPTTREGQSAACSCLHWAPWFFYVVKRFVEHSQPRRWRRGVQRPPCNRRLCLRNIPLSYITSLPLSTDGSAIQFHTSWLGRRQTPIRDWGSGSQQRQRFKRHQDWWSEEKRWVDEGEGNTNGGRWQCGTGASATFINCRTSRRLSKLRQSPEHSRENRWGKNKPPTRTSIL